MFILIPLFLLFSPSTAPKTEIQKQQIPYLMQTGQIERSTSLYRQYQKQSGKHDFEILQQMAYILLDLGMRSPDLQTQLLSLYGCGIAAAAASLDILEAGIKSTHAEAQLAAIQYLSKMQDDRSDELLIKAMSSPFFFVRMEAALCLANRKHKSSVGQIESLMYRVPPEARFFFPQFFALIGTSDAIAILRHLMEDSVSSVRVEALLSAAKFSRDDLLPTIRMHITHLDLAEQEAAAFALGTLKDSKSVSKLELLTLSSPPNVQIAAAQALDMLGNPQAKQLLMDQAAKRNLFAIGALSQIPQGKELLRTLCKDPDLAVRMNAAIALLRQGDPLCLNPILEILLRDVRDMGFLPQLSPGRTSIAFKPTFSSAQQANPLFDVQAISLKMREELLKEASRLPEEAFLTLAQIAFESRQADLIPLLVSLLEELQSPKAIHLLIQKAEQAGMPLIRTYCNLALYRLNQTGPYGARLKEWIVRNKDSAMIRFRPAVPMDLRIHPSPHELTPEESSQLLIEAYQTLAEKQQEESIDILLEAIEKGNPKNRYVLSGLLLRTLQ